MPHYFIHLRLHTEYSLQDSVVTIPTLIEKARQNQMPAIVITDFGNLYGVIKFYQAALDAGVKPIIGMDVFVQHTKTRISRCTLLCQNERGYQHLLELITDGYLACERKDDIPLLPWPRLQAKSDGLIVLSGAEDGNIGQAILSQHLDEAETQLLAWKTQFPDRF